MFHATCILHRNKHEDLVCVTDGNGTFKPCIVISIYFYHLQKVVFVLSGNLIRLLLIMIALMFGLSSYSCYYLQFPDCILYFCSYSFNLLFPSFVIMRKALRGHRLGQLFSVIYGRGDSRPSGSSIGRSLALIRPCLGFFPPYSAHVPSFHISYHFTIVLVSAPSSS